MRWITNCILLASIAVISASEDNDERIKRDLKFIKNLISAKLFGVDDVATEVPEVLVKQPETYRLFRIPGFEKILVKAIPKAPVVEADINSGSTVKVPESDFAELNPNVAIVNSYLGTSKLNDTLIALQGVKNLLQSGVLDARREGVEVLKPAYPTVVVESGQMVVNGGPRPIIVKDALPIPMIKGYRPVEVTRLPDLPIPTKYSYKQINDGGVMSYTAKDNQNVIVSESNRPVPLPPYVTYRIQEAVSMGSTYRRPLKPVPSIVATEMRPPPIPIYHMPKVEVLSPPVKVMPSYVSSGYSFNQVHVPPPVKVAAVSSSGGYSYNQIRNDGGVTTYSGSGQVVERKGERPTVVIAETTKPAPLPVFLTNRIEKVAATAMAAKIPSSVPHALYEAPVVYHESYPVVIEETPTYVYDHVSRFPPSTMNPWHRPVYREEVNVHVGKHRNQRPEAPVTGPSGYSYKSVHADGSVSTYTDSGVFEGGHREFEREGSRFFPIKYLEPHHFHKVYQPHLIKEEICVEPPYVHTPHIHGHSEIVHSKPGGYSYKTVHGDGMQTTYSGSEVHVEQHKVPQFVPVPMANPILNGHSEIVHSKPGGYSYKTVHGDGIQTTYSGSGVHVEQHKVAQSVPVPMANSALNGHSEIVHSKPGGYSYKTVHGDGIQTTYSGSGVHIEQHKSVPVPMVNLQPSVMVPELVPAGFFESNLNGPDKVMFSQPVVSKYVYKQVNHNDPNAFNTDDVALTPIDGQVQVKVGNKPALNVTPYPFVSASLTPKIPDLPSVTPKGPNEYVFVPPTDINEPLPTRRPDETQDQGSQSHSFTHITNEGIHTNKNGAAAFESATSASVIKVVKSSSSTSSQIRPASTKKVRVKTRVRTTTSTPTTTQLSLSANPIVVLPQDEQSFSFKQDRADGSSITVVGNNQNVSVIEENKADESHRGDIPSTSFK